MVGGKRFRRRHPLFRQLALLMAMPILVIGSSYALFSQTLTVNGNGTLPQYVSNNYTTVTYTKTATFAASKYTYTLNPLTIKNNGVTSITAWQVTFVVPADVTTVTSCPSTITCSINTTTHVITLSDTITVAAGGTNVVNNASTPIKFITATANYVPQNVTISATFATTYAAITGDRKSVV